MGKGFKCIVIDTDIASAASDRVTIDPRPKDCRELLEVIMDAEHRVVRTEAIRREWNKHQSLFTRKWLTSMFARKLICKVDAPTNEQLYRDIEGQALSDKKRDAMLKDTHLIEAALQADKIIISMDETVRQCFGEVTQKVPALAGIAWGNPCASDEMLIDWLQRGAPLEKERLFGYNSRENNSV